MKALRKIVILFGLILFCVSVHAGLFGNDFVIIKQDADINADDINGMTNPALEDLNMNDYNIVQIGSLCDATTCIAVQDLLSETDANQMYVPYVGATNDVFLGNNNFYTSGGRLYLRDATKSNTLSIYQGTGAVIETDTGNLTINAPNGSYIATGNSLYVQNASGTQSVLRWYDDLATNYGEVKHDGTNTVFSNSTGVNVFDANISASDYNASFDCISIRDGTLLCDSSDVGGGGLDTNIYSENVDVNLYNSSPEIRLTDSDNNEYTRWTWADSNHEGKILARLDEAQSAEAIDCETSDYVQVGTSSTLFNGENAFSMSFWWNPETHVSNSGVIWNKSNAGVYWRADKALWFYVTGSWLEGISYATHGIDAGTGWHHIVLTWQSSDGYYEKYIDGTKYTGSYNSNKTNSMSISNEWFINNKEASPDVPGDAQFDQVIMWNKKLSDNDVADIYNGGAGIYIDSSTTLSTDSTDVSDNLVVMYNFEGDATDGSGNGHNGVVSGSPTYVTGKTPSGTQTNEKNILTYRDDTSVVGQAGVSEWGDDGLLLKTNAQEWEVYLDDTEKYKLLNTSGYMSFPDLQYIYFGSEETTDANMVFDGTNFAIGTGTSKVMTVDGNIVANAFVTSSKVYDKQNGLALDLIKDSDEWRIGEKIDYDKHYSFVEYYIADKNKPVFEEKCVWALNKKSKELEQVCEDVVIGYEKKLVKGLDVETRISTLEQSVFELKTENQRIKDCLSNAKDFVNYKKCVEEE